MLWSTAYQLFVIFTLLVMTPNKHKVDKQGDLKSYLVSAWVWWLRPPPSQLKMRNRSFAFWVWQLLRYNPVLVLKNAARWTGGILTVLKCRIRIIGENWGLIPLQILGPDSCFSLNSKSSTSINTKPGLSDGDDFVLLGSYSLIRFCERGSQNHKSAQWMCDVVPVKTAYHKVFWKSTRNQMLFKTEICRGDCSSD